MLWVSPLTCLGFTTHTLSRLSSCSLPLSLICVHLFSPLRSDRKWVCQPVQDQQCGPSACCVSVSLILWCVCMCVHREQCVNSAAFVRQRGCVCVCLGFSIVSVKPPEPAFSRQCSVMWEGFLAGLSNNKEPKLPARYANVLRVGGARRLSHCSA